MSGSPASTGSVSATRCCSAPTRARSPSWAGAGAGGTGVTLSSGSQRRRREWRRRAHARHRHHALRAARPPPTRRAPPRAASARASTSHPRSAPRKPSTPRSARPAAVSRSPAPLTRAHAAGATVRGPLPADFCRPVSGAQLSGACREVRPEPLLRKAFSVDRRRHGAVVSARCTPRAWRRTTCRSTARQTSDRRAWPGFTRYDGPSSTPPTTSPACPAGRVRHARERARDAAGFRGVRQRDDLQRLGLVGRRVAGQSPAPGRLRSSSRTGPSR